MVNRQILAVALMVAAATMSALLFWPSPLPAPVADEADALIGIFERFDDWRARMRVTPADHPEHAALVTEGVALAGSRKTAMRNLMDSDPQAAAQMALSPGSRHVLPSSVQDHVERWRAGAATVEVLCPFPKPRRRPNPANPFAALNDTDEAMIVRADTPSMAARSGGARAVEHDHDHDHGHGALTYMYVVAFSEDESYQAATYGRFVLRAQRDPMPLQGFVLDGKFILSDSSARTLTADDIATADDMGLRFAGGATAASAFAPGAVAVFVASDEPAVDVTRSLSGAIHVYGSEAAASAAVSALHTSEDAHFATHFTNSMTFGGLDVIIFLVQFADESAPATTQANYEPTMAKINLYWNTNSWGQSSFGPFTYETIMVSGSHASYAGGGACPFDNGKTSPLDREVWSRSTYTESSFARYLILFSEYSECQWAGLGSIADSGSWINGLFDPVEHWHIAAHELGHNYGLKHANLWYGGGTGPVGLGQSLSYGDNFDVMGAVYIETDRFTFHANAEKKFGLNWIPPSDITSLSVTPAQSGQYRVFVLDNMAVDTGVRGIKIQRGGGSTTYYWIEFRQAIAYAPAAPYFQYGATIHWAYQLSAFASETDFLDMTPNYVSTNLYDNNQFNAPLGLGRTFNDPDFQIHITPLGISAQNSAPYMDIYVSFDPPNSAPTISSLTSSCTKPAQGESILLTATAADPDSDSMAYSWDFGDGSIPTSAALAVSHKWSTTGTKTVTVTVTDLRGSTATQSISTITVQATSECPACPNACSNKGLCSGGVCRCSPGYTLEDCSVHMVISSLGNNYGPISGGNVVTVSGTSFPNTATYVCNFQGIGTKPGTFVSATQVNCATPTTVTVKTTVILEISPNGGLDYTNSKKGYTFGGGFCLNNCTWRGQCEIGPGICHCIPGFTGTDCSTRIIVALVQPTPSEGPSSGGTQVILSITNGATAFTAAKSACRFGNTDPVPATLSTGPAPVTLTCIAPAFGSASTAVPLFIEASPNGVDFTNSSIAFTYRPIVELLAAQTSAPVVISGAASYAYFFFNLGDSDSATLSVNFAVTAGAASLRARSNVVPIPSVNTGTTALAAAGTMSLGATQLDDGVIYFSVLSGGGAATVTLQIVINGALALLSNGTAVKGFVDANAPAFFSFTHAGLTYASVVVVDVLNAATGTQPTLYLSLTSATPSAATHDKTGTVVAMQYCEAAGTFYVAVTAATTEYAIRFMELIPPTTGTIAGELSGEVLAVVRTPSSVLMQIALATDQTTYDFSLQYSVYFVKNSLDLAFATPCDVIRSGTPFRTGISMDPFASPYVNIAPLDSASNYQVSLFVASSLGIQQTYLPLLAKTKPPPIPKGIIIGLAAGCVAMACLAGSLVAFMRLRRKKRVHRKGARRRKTRRSAAGIVPGQPNGMAAIPDPRRGGGRQGGPRFQGARQAVAPIGQQQQIAGGVAAAPVPRTRTRNTPGVQVAGAKPATAPAAVAGGAAAGAAAAAGGPRRAQARGNFAAQYENELSFNKGDIIMIHAEMEAGWLRGEKDGRFGLVPASYMRFAQ